MKPTWVIALAVVLAVLLFGSVTAGPKIPKYGGDPDIYEGARPKDKAPREVIADDPGTCVTVDLPFGYRLVYTRQERTLRVFTVPGKVSATSGRSLFSK
jgi:hypothetical protein